MTTTGARRRSTVWVVGVSILAAVVGLAACGSTSAVKQSTPHTSGTKTVTIDDLAAAGVAVVADPTHSTPLRPVATSVPSSPLRLLQDQAEAMDREAAVGQGTLGSELDRLIGTDPGLPPPSYVLAGYVSAAQTPGAALARRVMGDGDWHQAPSLVFPGVVLTLFSADVVRFGAATATSTPTTSATGGQSLGLIRPIVASTPTATGPCSQVQGFIDQTIGALFDAIGHLQGPQLPTTSSLVLGFFRVIGQRAIDLAVGAVNGLIDAGRFLVVNGIKLATQPLMNLIAKVAGVVAVVASIVSALRPWTVRVDATPPQTRKAIGAEPGLPGTLSATVDLGGLDQWPYGVETAHYRPG